MENEPARTAKVQAQGEELEAIKEMLKIKIDGDWDEEMIGTAFDNLEALLCGATGEETSSGRSKRSAQLQRRRRRR
tara:strand:- start:811 stop:1038 length:228 start_codon:yes stop_codon:yes gene_type:complete